LIPALLSDLATTCEDTSLTTRIHRFRATLNTGDVHSSHSATWSTPQIRNCKCLGPDIRTIDYVIVTFNRLLSIHKGNNSFILNLKGNLREDFTQLVLILWAIINYLPVAAEGKDANAHLPE
jgi:hypothetical protein